MKLSHQTILRRSRHHQLTGLALAALCLAPLLCPCARAADNWALQPVPGSQVDYVKLDDLRGIYKFSPEMQDRKAGTRKVSNGSTTLAFGPDPHQLSIQGVVCRLSHPTCTNARGDLLVSLTDVVKLIDPVLRPTYIAKRRDVKTIVIDPGHGGQDVGLQSAQVREADFTASLARLLAAQLAQRGYEVLITREGNGNLPTQRRIDLANGTPSAIFISLHLNSGPANQHGIQTYTVTPYAPPARQAPPAEGGSNSAPATEAAPSAAPSGSHENPLLEAGIMGVMPGNEQDGANIALAFALQSALVHATGAQDGGCRRTHYSMLSSIRCPAAIVELGYATHEQEAQLLNTEEYRATLATALADGVDAFARAIRPGARPPVNALPPPPEPPTPVKVNTPAPDSGKKSSTSSKSSGKKTTSKGKTIRKSKTRSRKNSSEKRSGRKR